MARVLCVDDDPQVLKGLASFLERTYDVHVAVNGAQGLVVLDQHGPFDVVISDMRMPGMDGSAFLAEVADYVPHTTRILMAGPADIQAAVKGMHRGRGFRLLMKPCAPKDLRQTVDDAVELCRLRRAEPELLEETLVQCVSVLSEILSITSPERYGRAHRMRRIVRGCVRYLGLKAGWKYELAALLSQIGKVAAGQIGTVSHYELASHLLERIPRLEEIRRMVADQFVDVSLAHAAQALHDGHAPTLGAHLLRVAHDLDQLLQGGRTPPEAVAVMENRTGTYNPAVLNAALGWARSLPDAQPIRFSDLVGGMVLLRPLRLLRGDELVPASHEVSAPLVAALKRTLPADRIEEPLWVQPLAPTLDNR